MNRFKIVSRIIKDSKNLIFKTNGTNTGTTGNIFKSSNPLHPTFQNKINKDQCLFYSTWSQSQNYKHQYQYKEQQQQEQSNNYSYKKNRNNNEQKNIKNKTNKYKLGVLLSPTLLFTTGLTETSAPLIDANSTSGAEIEFKSNNNTIQESNSSTHQISSPDISCSTSNESSQVDQDDSTDDIMKVDQDDSKDTDDQVSGNPHHTNILNLSNNNINNNNMTSSSGGIFTICSDDEVNNSNIVLDENEPFHLHSGICVIPHPNKRHKGGEDAYFISQDRRVIGVADGVGGWGDVGIDPREYSNTLMEGSKLASNSSSVNRDPLTIMEQGYIYSQDVKGSSTCCIVVIGGRSLQSANLGDSGFLVIRNSEIIFRTREQQHAFNMPYQLGTQSIDRPIHSITSSFTVEKGDLVIMGTDGVFDNLFDDEILHISEKNNSDPQVLARLIAKRAFEIGCSTTTFTPFAKNAGHNGYIYSGGKLDDITVIVGIVSEGPLKPIRSDMLLLDEDFKNDEY